MVTTGVLSAARSDSALAFVLGREMSRIVAKHDCDEADPTLDSPTRPRYPNFIRYTKNAKHPGFAARSKPWIGLDGSIPLRSMGFLAIEGFCELAGQASRDEEADYIGLLLMTSADHDPGEANVFRAAMKSSGWRLANPGSRFMLRVAARSVCMTVS